MDSCSKIYLDPEWQATSLGFLINLRNVVLALPENYMNIYQHVPKPLTRGAVYMIYMMLIFVLLAVSGTTITVYEFLLDSRNKKAKPYENYTAVSKKILKDKVAKKFPESSKPSLNKFKSFLSCFCVLKNGRKLLSTSNKDQFECFRGIRFLNNFWIILIHIFLAYWSSIKNAAELKPLMEMWSFQLVLNGLYAVDTFFVLSGFLNAYSFFNNYDKSDGNVSWLHFYLKRFLRLTPVYMVVFGFYTFLIPYMGSGPLWPAFDTNPVCSRNWFWSLLYVNNFLDHSRQCMEWCWYLAADMQFYIISPIFLILLIRNPILGYVLTGACIVASCLASFIITKQYNLVDGFSRIEYRFDGLLGFYDQYREYFDLVYIKPHTRISSYLVAILLAHYLYKRKFKIKFSNIILFIGWIVTSILWFIAYFAMYKREEYITENAVYNGIKHLFYSFGVLWIILTCLTGQGGLVNRYLAWKYFSPLSKLSYCAYLIHPLLMLRYYQTATNLEDFSASSALVLVAYVYFWTYVLSFITNLIFEFPVLNLLDLISTKNKVEKHV